jgi:hypothetical protein
MDQSLLLNVIRRPLDGNDWKGDVKSRYGYRRARGVRLRRRVAWRCRSAQDDCPTVRSRSAGARRLETVAWAAAVLRPATAYRSLSTTTRALQSSTEASRSEASARSNSSSRSGSLDGSTRASRAAHSGSAISIVAALPLSCEFVRLKHDYGLSPLRVRGLERVAPRRPDDARAARAGTQSSKALATLPER